MTEKWFVEAIVMSQRLNVTGEARQLKIKLGVCKRCVELWHCASILVMATKKYTPLNLGIGLLPSTLQYRLKMQQSRRSTSFMETLVE